jgi:hypothetical protein
MTDRFRRRKSWDSPHDRARSRAAERLWEVLPAGEAEWLDRHLAECRDCSAVADSYEAQRLEVRGLRDRAPVPPRDLWARTAAAIEREDARRRPSLRPDPAPRMPLLRRKRPSPVPLGLVSGVLVVAVVVGVSLLGGRQTTPQVVPLQSPPLIAVSLPPLQTTGPSGTPIVVAAGDVGWMRYGPDGQIDVFFSPIDEVCADAEGPDCAPIDEASPRSGEIADAPPEAVVKSPDDKSLIVVQGPTDNGAGKVIVVPVPTAPGSTPEPTPVPTPVVTPTPPVETPPPPVETPTPPAETPTAPVDTPTAPVETPTPPLESPTQSPLTGPLEIASGVIVVGQSAAYSPDGVWFAFSARPTDGSAGPDIYVWRVGDPQALPITVDHRSVFSGWLDGRMIGSRAVVVETVAEGSPVPTDASPVPTDASPVPTDGSPAPTDASPSPTVASPAPLTDLRPEAFLLDPATGAETALPAAPFWRPSVDPSGRWAVYWDGTVSLADNGFEWRAASGQLVVGAWPPVPEEPAAVPGSEPPASEAPASGSPDASPVSPDASPVSPAVSPDESATPSSSPSPEPTALPQVIDTSAIRDWDARWDETGTHLAIWIADQADPAIGRLSLYVFDPATGTLDLAEPLLSAQPALPGFSIASDRLAWATPDNQDGEGSHVEVLAWKGSDSGQVQSAPGDDQVVVIR